MKKLPLGISTFSEIIEKDYLYIDKTQIAYDLIQSYKHVFLSRPRRFGKSVFLDTLKEIFEGNKALFKDLAIYDQWDWDDSFPVIRISFGGNRSAEELKQNIFKELDFCQKALDINCEEDYDYALCFSDLIQKSYEKYQKPVVILIDEYDKPILDNLDQMDVAIECQHIILRLYSQIKENDRYIHFSFLTGVTRFSTGNIFGGFNILLNISWRSKYGNICGYTQQDIETTIAPYLKGVDLDRLKRWYNGYNFLNDSIYNPYDILLFIDNNHRYENYWFKIVTPSFLIESLIQKKYLLSEFDSFEVNSDLLGHLDIETFSPETFMLQAGYLSIKTVEQLGSSLLYTLSFPNMEVKNSFNNYFSSIDHTWDSFILSDKSVSNDFMQERASQKQLERDRF